MRHLVVLSLDRAASAPGWRERTQHGQSLVETALVLPFLVLLLAIVVDTGRIFDAAIVLSNAAREGARFATLEPSPTVPQIQDLVVEDVLGSGTNITHMADFARTNVDVVMGSTAITVTVAYDFDLWFGGILGVPTLSLSRHSAMPLFQEP